MNTLLNYLLFVGVVVVVKTSKEIVIMASDKFILTSKLK